MFKLGDQVELCNYFGSLRYLNGTKGVVDHVSDTFVFTRWEDDPHKILQSPYSYIRLVNIEWDNENN